MAEQDLTGTAPATQPTVNAMNAPVPPVELQAPQEPTPQPQTPGGGKSAEQLAAELQEASELIRETQERLARMEHQAELERQMRANLTAGKGQETETPEIDFDKLDGEYMQSPTRATAKIVQAQFAQLRQEQERERTAQYITNARSAFETGLAEAEKENPALFKVTKGAVSSETLNTIKQGLEKGQPVDLEVLRDKRYWKAAALANLVMQAENDDQWLRYFTHTRTPMTAGHTETPTAGGPPQAAPALTPQELAMAQFLGGTPEQWAKAKAGSK